jgi:hypothetical protein
MSALYHGTPAVVLPPLPILSPPPADAASAIATYNSWVAQVLGQDLPRTLQAIQDQLGILRGL